MHAYPGFDRRMMRALLWLSVLATLAAFGAARARAESAPPASAPANATTAQPAATSKSSTSAVTTASSGTTQPASTPAASPASKPATVKSKSSKHASKASRPPVSAAAVSQATDVNASTVPGASNGPSTTNASSSDTTMTLHGGQARTDFRTLTVEGEDRVHVEVERPPLALDLDPDKVHGLESGTAADVLNRVAPDLTTAYLATSTNQPMPYVARPWLSQFATGAVARFEPNVKDVDRWKLMVADSKGQVVKTFEGKGDPPKQMQWDGRSQNGNPVTPGLTYSYIFEAYDKAGNKRNFVGQGFRISAYRLDAPSGPVLVFSGQNLLASQKSGTSFGMGAGTGPRQTPSIILEAASWLNQSEHVAQPIRVTATARGYEQASFLAKVVGNSLSQYVLGDPTRIQTVGEVVPDAPDGGMVRIALGVTPDAATTSGLLAPPPVKSEPAKDGKKSSSDKKNKK